MKKLFGRGDILLPKNTDMKLWSVIACDQYTSQPEYWDKVSENVGSVPSTLRLILPEAYLERCNEAEETAKINCTMEEYLKDGVFEVLEQSMVYIERQLISGEIRHGLLGLIDLEEYDYSPESVSPIHATEGTVESRLPPRVKVRQGAALELPHIIVFVDDPENTVLGSICGGESLYDFELMDGGGRITGRRISGEQADRAEAAIAALGSPENIKKRYGDCRFPVVIAMGDGNHSLATAKLCWEQLKPSLSPEERESHPARFGLAELVNIHDSSIAFEPIHRLIFDTDGEGFFDEAKEFFESNNTEGSTHHRLLLAKGDKQQELFISGHTIGSVIDLAQEFCLEYIRRHGGRLDYIHDDATALSMAEGKNSAGLLLPTMDKNELFPSIMASGAFPAKSFSIGPSRDKRYYLECRKIK